jgi:hypothetical protein
LHIFPIVALKKRVKWLCFEAGDIERLVKCQVTQTNVTAVARSEGGLVGAAVVLRDPAIVVEEAVGTER